MGAGCQEFLFNARRECKRDPAFAEQGRPVAEGEPANLCVIDPSHQWVVEGGALASRSSNTPWEGWKLTGKVRHTIYNGTPTVRDYEATK